MRLISFSVKNFRSISGSNRIQIGDSTVLIGKNNEGKSNLLRALAIAMRALTSHANEEQEERSSHKYYWKRDFPISLQTRARGTESIFRLEFLLDDNETNEFKETIRSNLNGSLPIEIKFGKSNIAEIHVPKRGPGGNALSAKSNKIAKYIAEHIQFNYIPAIRTEDEALSVVMEMLSTELSLLERNDEYLQAIKKISELQDPILQRVSASIKDSLDQFLPNINEVKVLIPPSARRIALRSKCQVLIDDGTLTALEYKGDGVKSLAALGLLKDKHRLAGASIIAIEEPESHLHPGAMHSLRNVIDNLTTTNQVVITTHCPLFVDRGSISKNILIDGNSAKSAKDISSIRDLLGIRASDNLVNASHVLVVEGSEDILILKALLPRLSVIIEKAIKQHHLVIEQIGGAGNLSYKLTTLSNALCVTHVLLDNDEAGRNAFSKAETEKTIRLVDTTFVNCNGMPNSEFEDCFNVNSYQAVVLQEFGVDLNHSDFKGNNKWSDRAKNTFHKQGKQWNNSIESQLKHVVGSAIAQDPVNALNIHKRNSLDALVKALERKLEIRSLA